MNLFRVAPLLVLLLLQRSRTTTSSFLTSASLSLRSRASAGIDHCSHPYDARDEYVGRWRASSALRERGLLDFASSLIPRNTLISTVSKTWNFAWKQMMAELAPQDEQGNYQRPVSMFQQTKVAEGDANEFVDEDGRYHLYVGNTCPWCHRTVLTAKLMQFMPQELGVTFLGDDANRGGWIFLMDEDPDPLMNAVDLRQLYRALEPTYDGKCTAPVLVDKKTKRIISNESSDIVRLLNSAKLGQSEEAAQTRINLYPIHLQKEIDETNEWVYRLLNNGVYRCGFATSQQAYDQASADVRKGLKMCDQILSKQRFLHGNEVTESDIYLLPTMLRFDGVYSPLFKAGGAQIRLQCDFPHVHRWMKDCWNNVPGVSSSIDLGTACQSYYRNLFPLNPGLLVPVPVTPLSIGLAEQ